MQVRELRVTGGGAWLMNSTSIKAEGDILFTVSPSLHEHPRKRSPPPTPGGVLPPGVGPGGGGGGVGGGGGGVRA